MKITLDNLTKKLESGWSVLDHKGNISYFTLKKNTKIEVNGTNVVSFFSSKKKLNEVKIVGLIHPDNEDKVIAVDSVFDKATATTKTKVKIVVFETYYDTNYVISAYCIYKAIAAYGADNVEVVEFNWADNNEDGDMSRYEKNSDDTYVMFLGYSKSVYPTMKYDIAIPIIKYSWFLEAKVGSVVSRLKSINILPNISVEDEKAKLISLASNTIWDDIEYALNNFLNGYMSGLEIPRLVAALTSTKDPLSELMSKYLNSDTAKISLNGIRCLKEDLELAKEAGVDELHKYVLLKQIIKVESRYVVSMSLKEKGLRHVNYYIVGPGVKIINMFYPGHILVSGNDEYMDVYVPEGRRIEDFKDVLSKVVKPANAKNKTLKRITINLED